MSGPASTQVIGELLASRASLSGAHCAIIDGDARLSFAALDARANRAAHLLADCGLDHGDRVGLLAPNSAVFCEMFYGCARSGVICCGLNFRLSPAELAAIIADSGMRVLLVAPEFADLAAAATAQSGAAVRIEPLGGAQYETRMAVMPDNRPAVLIAPEDALALVYTSGTTGLPKGAQITHDHMFWASLTIGQSVDYRQDDVHLLPVPMFHVGGLSFTVHFVHAGATLLMPGPWDAARVLDLIEAHGAAHFFCVPTMLQGLLDRAEAMPDRLRSVRWILAGGAPVPAALIHRFDALGIPVMQSYGATETCGPGIFVDRDHAARKAGAIGKPFFHTQCRLVDDTGQPVGAGEYGEIRLRGRHVFSGYWNNPAATAEALDADGWFRTGDVGFSDSDGYIFLVDRKKNLIISGGENIYPREIEMILETHPAVADVAVVGLPDPHWGEVPCVVMACREGQSIDLDEITAFCHDRLARYKLPRRLHVCAALPRNATGKLLRAELMARLQIEYTPGS
jgi:O-succinylbenzoate-CoA ligase